MKLKAVLLSTLWIVTSEFLRNEILFKSYWVSHYKSLGLIFPDRPINGVIWLIWSLGFSVFIHKISSKFNFNETFILSYLAVFIMMWLTIGNLQVLPIGLLYFAIPLGALECFVAIKINNYFK